MFSRHKREPESGIGNTDMEPEMVGQTTDTAKHTGSNENEDENTSMSSSQVKQWIDWEPEDPNDMRGLNTEHSVNETSSQSTVKGLTATDDTSINTENTGTYFLKSSNVEKSEKSSTTNGDEEPDDMSTMKNSDVISVAASDNEIEFELKPFDFLSYPDKVRQQLLRAALVSNKHISPYWNLFAPEVGFEDALVENYTEMLAAFAGNKELLDQATTILYSENRFHLKSAKISLWWLKRIGSNISKIRHLTISVNEGVMDPFNTRLETIWSSIFSLLQGKHNLRTLTVSFTGWTNEIDTKDHLDPLEDVDIWEPRYAAVRSLLDFRGLEYARIVPGPYVTPDCTEILEDALILGPGETNDCVRHLESMLQVPERAEYWLAYAGKRTKTKAPENTEAAGDSIMSEDTIATEQSPKIEVHITTEEQIETEGSVTTQEPVTTDDSDKTEAAKESGETEGAVDTEGAVKTEEAVETEEPDETNEPTNHAKPRAYTV